MNTTGHRFFWAGVSGLFVIAALYLATVYRGAFRTSGAVQESEWQRKYWTTVPKAEQADEAGNWAEAARLHAEIINLLPHGPVSHYGLARALAHLERDDEALEELRQSIELGWADIEGLRSEPAFERIRGRSGFESVLDRGKEIADEPVAVYVPPGLDKKTLAPLVITFHGLGENPHSHIRSWKQAADRLGAVVAAPRGVGRIDHGAVHSFRWTTPGGDQDRKDFLQCKGLLQQCLDLAGQRADIDVDRIVLAGYSQGGSVALALLADAPDRFRGAVVEATSWSPRILETWNRPPSGRQARVYLIVHEFDRTRPQGEEAYHALKDAGIDARLEVVRGADHEIPLHNDARQTEAVRFVLGLDSAAP
jgi:predicted esterase